MHEQDEVCQIIDSPPYRNEGDKGRFYCAILKMSICAYLYVRPIVNRDGGQPDMGALAVRMFVAGLDIHQFPVSVLPSTFVSMFSVIDVPQYILLTLLKKYGKHFGLRTIELCRGRL